MGNEIGLIDEPLTRRRLVHLGAGLTAAGAIGGLARPLGALAAPPRWPDGTIGAKGARHVDPAEFMPLRQMRAWQRELDGLGLRATGSARTERLIRTLRSRLERLGVEGARLEAVPMERWLAKRWSLHVTGKTMRVASYVPYSGRTGPAGVAGKLVNVDPSTTPAPGSLKGKIAVFDVPLVQLTTGAFEALGYPNRTYDPHHELNPTDPYVRPWFNEMGAYTQALQAAGAAGMVGILDLPAAFARGSYFPYDGQVRSIPGLYVDRKVGARIKELAGNGARGRLTLEAQVRQVKTHNLIGFIPGASKELTVIHTHTDGTNGIEENGPTAISAISQYLARIRRGRLPRTIMVLMTSGHFAGGVGALAFIKRHRNDLVKRATAALTLEHLGALEYLPRSDGSVGPTGRPELGGIFTPDKAPLIDTSYRALEHARAAPAIVLRPFVPAPTSEQKTGWPGEGTYLWTEGSIPDANYITGPLYLLNAGMRTMDKIDMKRMRRESIAFTEQLLALAATSRSELDGGLL